MVYKEDKNVKHKTFAAHQKHIWVLYVSAHMHGYFKCVKMFFIFSDTYSKTTSSWPTQHSPQTQGKIYTSYIIHYMHHHNVSYTD